MREIILHSWFEKTLGAVLEEGKVVEWLFDSPSEGPQPGTVFQGKVIDILPGMDAAFVDIGFKKNGFLYKKELIDYQREKIVAETEANQIDKPISSLIKKGQKILVQVKKEEVGTKGAKLTEVLSFPGKYIVYIPEGKYVAVSKKMSSEEIRDNWRERGHEWIVGNEGVIFRTLVEEVDLDDVLAELERMRELYESIIERSKKSTKTVVSLYNESSTIARIARDFLYDNDSIIVVDQLKDYKLLKDHLSSEKASKVKLHNGKDNAFTHHQLYKELEKSLEPFVWMRNGGSLRIDHTEAMTVVDVNSARFIGKQGLNETAVKINIEAAKTIAEQLRLRDIGGIILIDFIDMKLDEDRNKVTRMLKNSLEGDRTVTNVLGFTQLGLLEMTRKKTRKPLHEAMLTACPTCHGRGEVKKAEEVAQALEESLYSLRFSDGDALLVEVEPRIYKLFMKDENTRLIRLEEMTEKAIYFLVSHEVSGHEIRLIGDHSEVYKRWKERT